MAKQNSTSTLKRADRPTAPLPSAAASALARLDLRLNAPEVLPAVARYEVASFRTAQMSRWMNTRDLTDAEFDDFEFAQDTMAAARATLAAAGMLHLIEAASYVRVSPEIERAVTRYGICLETVLRLTMMDARRMTGAQFDLLADAQDELTRLHEQLEQAGQLHLVVAS